jgi:hypothetical protein
MIGMITALGDVEAPGRREHYTLVPLTSRYYGTFPAARTWRTPPSPPRASLRSRTPTCPTNSALAPVGTAAVSRPPHRPNVEAGSRETECQDSGRRPSGHNQLPSIINQRDDRAFVTG